MSSRKCQLWNFLKPWHASLWRSLFQLLAFTSLLVLNPPTLLAKEWRGLIPLHSSRTDVERILGRASDSGALASSYELKDEFVEILFAKGPPCGSSLVDIWRVPRNTVVGIRVIPKTKWLLSSVLEDNSQYVQTIDPIDKEISFYTNEESGLRYTIHSGEQLSQQYIVSIDYFPGKNENSQKCPSSSGADGEIQTFPTFERFGNISSSMEKAILDNFAIQLLRNKELQGYVVVYVDPGAKRNAGQRRIRSIKRYLTSVRGVPPKRVISKQGGRRAEAGVELYLLPHGALKPGFRKNQTMEIFTSPSPTCGPFPKPTLLGSKANVQRSCGDKYKGDLGH